MCAAGDCSSMRLSGGRDLLYDRDPRDTHRSGVDGINPVGTLAQKSYVDVSN